MGTTWEMNRCSELSSNQNRTNHKSILTLPRAALSNSIVSSPSPEKLVRTDNKPNYSRELKLQWAGSRERISTPVEAERFFLTSLFIELIDSGWDWTLTLNGAGEPTRTGPGADPETHPRSSADAMLTGARTVFWRRFPRQPVGKVLNPRRTPCARNVLYLVIS
jgi:hypothetical protein